MGFYRKNCNLFALYCVFAIMFYVLGIVPAPIPLQPTTTGKGIPHCCAHSLQHGNGDMRGV
jgi:hypothetical protein